MHFHFSNSSYFLPLTFKRKINFVRYRKQDSMAIFNYTFDMPLIRYLYSKNKTDLALELFLAEVRFLDIMVVVTLFLSEYFNYV